MSAVTEPPLRHRIQPRVMRVVNVPMRKVLGLPFPTPLGQRLMRAEIIGGKSGRVYHQPLSYVRDGDVLLTPGGGNWKRNLVPGEPVRLRVAGRDIQARPELVRDIDEIQNLLATMVAANSRVASFIGIPRDADGRFDRDRLETAVQYGFCIVRWRLDPPA